MAKRSKKKKEEIPQSLQGVVSEMERLGADRDAAEARYHEMVKLAKKQADRICELETEVTRLLDFAKRP